MPQLPPIDPKLQCKLESLFGPDPLNPCADLAGIGSTLYKRIHALREEANNLEVMYNNTLLGMDRIIAEERANASR
jgi:hypothetical protein